MRLHLKITLAIVAVGIVCAGVGGVSGYRLAEQQYRAAFVRENVADLNLVTRLNEHVLSGDARSAQLILDTLATNRVARLIELDQVALDDGTERLKTITLSILHQQWTNRPPLDNESGPLKESIDWHSDWPKYRDYVASKAKRLGK